MTSSRKNILAICGSTKESSLNMSLIHAISNLTMSDFSMVIFKEIADIPHFNPDLDKDAPPAPVVVFRELFQKADGVLICTPEYAMGVPGTLKNALDWTVSSCDFSHKPTALITASSQGFKSHQSLLGTLQVIEAAVTDETQLVVSFVKAKVGNDHSIKDPETEKQVLKVMQALKNLIDRSGNHDAEV